ncbi:hypothetical protein ACWEWI_25305 [Streptomyces sp. NPDC003753]
MDRLKATIRALSIVVGVLGGLAGALICYLVVRHLGAAPLGAAASSGGGFIAVSTFIYFIEEKLGLL